MRALVIGTSGAGKSTFARALARRIEAPYVELDALHWDAHWTPHSRDEFRAGVRVAIAGERWVVDGNYTVARDLLWPAATDVVWLNFSRRVVFTRILGRTVRRALRREELWAGNRESVGRAFFSHDSILLWSLTTFGKNRAKYGALRRSPEFGHLAWHEARTPRAADRLLAALAGTLR